MPENAAALVAARRRIEVSSSIMPRCLLDLPIWLDAKAAAGKAEHRISWVHEGHLRDGTPLLGQRIVTQKTHLPSGLLRHLDLDVAMAIGHEYITTQRQRLICDQADLLRWMGYGGHLAPPRSRITASLERLSEVLVTDQIGEECPPEGIKRYRILGGWSKSRTTGNLSTVSISLSDDWCNALETGRWTEVNLDAYAYLVRTHRSAGLARVLFAYITSCRQSLAEFSVPYGAIFNRFAQRHTDGRFRHSDPSNPRNPLSNALRLLESAGIMKFDRSAAKNGLIAGEFRSLTPDKKFTRAPRQTTIWPRDISGSFVSEPPPTRHDIETRELLKSTDLVVIEEDHQVAQSAPPLASECRAILRQLPALSGATIVQARQRGWTDAMLVRALGEVLWRAHEERAQDPAAYAVSVLHGDPSTWSKEAQKSRKNREEIKAFLYGPDGPLHGHQSGSRHLPTNKQETLG